MNNEKPFKGTVKSWWKVSFDIDKARAMYPEEDVGLGYYIRGMVKDHPQFGTSRSPTFHTSYVVSHNEETGEIVTRNSRYLLEGPK